MVIDMAKARMLGIQSTGAKNAKAAPPYWAVKRGKEILCHGPESTIPGEQEQRMLKRDGYRLTIGGKGRKL